MGLHWNLTFKEANLEAEFLADRKGRLWIGLRRLAWLTFFALGFAWISWLAFGRQLRPFQVCVGASAQTLSFLGILLTWRTECPRSFSGEPLEYLGVATALLLQMAAISNDNYYGHKLEGINAPEGDYSDTRVFMAVITTMIAVHVVIPVRWSRAVLGDLLSVLGFSAFVLAVGSPEGVTAFLNVTILAVATCCLLIGQRQLEQSERSRFVDIVEAKTTLLQQNNELRQHGQLVSKLLDSLCDATVVVQQNFEIIQASPSFAGIMAMPKEQMVGRKFLSYVHSVEDRLLLEDTVDVARGHLFEGNDGFDTRSSGLVHVVLEDALSQTFSVDIHFAVLGEAQPMILGIKESSERRASTVSRDQVGVLLPAMPKRPKRPKRTSEGRVGSGTKAKELPFRERELEPKMVNVVSMDDGTLTPLPTPIGKSSACASSSCSSSGSSEDSSCFLPSSVPDTPDGGPQPIDGLWTAMENNPVNAPQTVRIICGRVCFSNSDMKLTLFDDGKYRKTSNDKGFFALDETGLLHVVSGSGQAVLYRRSTSVSDAV